MWNIQRLKGFIIITFSDNNEKFGDMKYFISEWLGDKVDSVLSGELTNKGKQLHLTQYANVVLSGNQIVKCRWELDDVFTFFMSHIDVFSAQRLEDLVKSVEQQ